MPEHTPDAVPPPEHRLNILALPGQTTVRVAQVILIVFAATVAVGAAALIAPIALLPVVLLLLSPARAAARARAQAG